MTTMPGSRRQLGRSGPYVFPLGSMGMSGIYGAAEEDESIATIHAALGAGATLIDTGDFYGLGHSELLIGSALPDRALLAVRFGALRGPDGSWMGVDTRPAGLAVLAADKGVTSSQPIAWVLSRGETIAPVIGARRRTQLTESLDAPDVELSDADVASLEATISSSAIAGTRYDAHQMRMPDSER